ncbi:hypothetical protein BDV26DRAFT_94420 [Aspergillus bertholletiae]|uniref:Uncharacterized protein n=1 Tax=Aspergillus bertholletiae TaxID=1226010 RepID=A0A5N7BP83_9EURO|nr:hypothetical protein BDV26DRAFT_94420 [Aspergillus bertholletiae]
MIFLAAVTMDTENTHAQDSDYTQSPWLDLGAFSPSQQSPPLDYHGFGYGILPLESAYGVSVPPPYASLPLTMPSNTWPSMMSNHPQNPFPEGSVPPVPIPPTVSPVTHNPPPPPPPPPPPRKSSTSNSTPRRTLTDDDRRRMCLYHEEHKTAKQTDIGGQSCTNSFSSHRSYKLTKYGKRSLEWNEGNKSTHLPLTLI